VFDLVHLGHVRHIHEARSEGGVVMARISANGTSTEGPGRPIFPENVRAEMLASLANVGWVGISHASSAEPVLNSIRFDIHVKGSDYENPEDEITGKIKTELDAVRTSWQSRADPTACVER
jgi:cytidyltransferase-like protein